MLADPAEWQRDPWSGDLVDGEVWGRGALDMKDQVAASAVAFASLAREGFRPPGDLLFVAAADEEVGEGLRPRVARARAPGRGSRRLRDQRGRRRAGRARRAAVLPLRGGREDVGAVPAARARPQRPRVDAGDRGQRARQGGAAIEPLGAYRPRAAIGPEVAGFLERVLGELPRARATRSRGSRGVDPLAAELVEPLLSFTSRRR